MQLSYGRTGKVKHDIFVFWVSICVKYCGNVYPILAPVKKNVYSDISIAT